LFVINHLLPDHTIFTLKISILKLTDLYPHEMVVPHLLEKLVKEIKRSSILMNPIIVDERTRVILDGMHRYYALRELGYEYIVACLVRYEDPHIKVRNWYREIWLEGPIDDMVSKISQEYCTEKCNIDVAMEELNSKNAIAAIMLKQRKSAILILPEETLSIKALYDEVYRLERILTTTFRAKITYQADALALRESGANAIMATPPIAKKDVVEVALRGEVFPPKTTRHIIPARPLFVNVPLKLLSRTSEDLDLKERNKILNIILRQRNLMKIRGGINIDRFYAEDHLYVFI